MFFSIISVNAQNFGLNGNDKTHSFIYPNPATNQINIKFKLPSKATNVSVYSIIGNEVLNKKVDQPSNFRMNVQNLKKGKYIVRIFNNDGTTESVSLIKN